MVIFKHLNYNNAALSSQSIEIGVSLHFAYDIAKDRQQGVNKTPVALLFLKENGSWQLRLDIQVLCCQ